MALHRIRTGSQLPDWPLYDTAATRRLEARLQSGLPPHDLMRRAGQAVYRLSAALTPHARRVWVACGGGNNGGDGFLAAAAWQARLAPVGGEVVVTWPGQEDRLPADARQALALTRQSGARFAQAPPASPDLVIDAIFGIGLRDTPRGETGSWIEQIQQANVPVVCVDLPSGLEADHGHWLGDTPPAPSPQRHTLSLLTLKPGLFTHQGRDAAGTCWFDDLDIGDPAPDDPSPIAWLHTGASGLGPSRRWKHQSHKGLHGDLLVIGGQIPSPRHAGMTGAAILAARAGLRAGAGRVYVGLLNASSPSGPMAFDPLYPELMFRSVENLIDSGLAACAVSVCGCGAGEAVAEILPRLLAISPMLVLDADALNAIARDPTLSRALAARAGAGQLTVLTPHPLEAARLLDTDVTSIQSRRLEAAQTLAERMRCVVVLKGSGSITAAPGVTPRLNLSGNGLLATAGTGDVLAGMMGALLCQTPRPPSTPACDLQRTAADAVYLHGLTADRWPDARATMCASDVIQGLP